MADAFSYTQATGKRPKRLNESCYRWTSPDPSSHRAPENLPEVVFNRLDPDFDPVYPQPWLFRTEDAALAAADAAYDRAVAEGAMKPIEGVS